jgi:hypothetical protein
MNGPVEWTCNLQEYAQLRLPFLCLLWQSEALSLASASSARWLLPARRCHSPELRSPIYPTISFSTPRHDPSQLLTHLKQPRHMSNIVDPGAFGLGGKPSNSSCLMIVCWILRLCRTTMGGKSHLTSRFEALSEALRHLKWPVVRCHESHPVPGSRARPNKATGNCVVCREQYP